jgi:hypothetical protein
MATTIQSGRSSSPLLTADVASRAEIYGGRGLVFDGVSDYLDLPSSSLFNHSGNYSISVWIKKIGQPNSNVDTNANPTIIAKGNVYFTLFVNHDGMLGTFFYNSSNATDYNIKTADGVIQLNVWHHVVLTWNNTSSQLYVDGKQEYSGSYTPYNLNTGVNGRAVKIGDKESPTADTSWHGNMCDMKIFDSHITEAQVTELYLKPENTPSAIQDSIVAWYPMSEANPESPQSIVYDHSEKKLSVEKAQDNTFSNTTNSQFWNGQSSISNNKLHILGSNHGGSQSGNCFIDQNSSNNAQVSSNLLTSGSLYKITGTITVNSLNGGEYMRSAFDASFTRFLPSLNVGTESFTIYVIANSSYINIQIPNCGANTNIAIDAFFSQRSPHGQPRYYKFLWK